MSVTFQLKNLRKAITGTPAADFDLNFMITGIPPKSGQPINLNSGVEIGVSQSLNDYINGPNKGAITFDYIDSGRLYIGYGDLPYGTKGDEATVPPEYRIPKSSGQTVQPVPYWKRYYGVVEFAYVPGDTGLWIDITNVNLAALPISLAGYTVFGEAFSLGYKDSVEKLRALLEAKIGTTGGCPNPTSAKGIASKITCVTGSNKIVSPTAGNAACYRSFDPYVTALAKDSTQISITSDTNGAGNYAVFTGGFVNGSSNVIELKGTQSNSNYIPNAATVTYTLNIPLAQLNTANIYACANGKISFSKTTTPEGGKATTISDSSLPFDADAKTAGAAGAAFSTDDFIISNSTVRNILIGINEGRFVPTSGALSEKNDNANWGTKGHGPFPNPDYGSQYAQVIYENANAYGYPYADKYLKALAVAYLGESVVITACPDTASCGYSPTPPPSVSNYNLIMGAHCQSLGGITIGSSGKSASIMPLANGSYTGQILPPTSSYTRLNFAGAGGKYIWYKKTKAGISAIAATDANGNACLLQNGGKMGLVTWYGNDLKFGADLTWNPAADSAVNPDA